LQNYLHWSRYAEFRFERGTRGKIFLCRSRFAGSYIQHLA